MSDEKEIVPGFNDAKESLMAKLEETIEMYLLTKLKWAEFREGEHKSPAIAKELKENLYTLASKIEVVIKSDIENN